MRFSIRPKGMLYIAYTLVKYIFLVGLFSLFVFAIVDGEPLDSGNIIKMIEDIFFIAMCFVFVFLICLQTREIIRYKMVISEDKLYIAANRDFLLTRHKDIAIEYGGIEALQFCKYLRPELIQKGMFFFSAIYIKRKDSSKEEYVLTMWFSKNQVEFIIQQMALLAEKQNGYPVEILPAKIK